MADANKLLLAQEDAGDRIGDFISTLSKSPKDRMTLGYCTERLNGLKELWMQYMINHKAIIEASTSEIRANHVYFTTKLYKTLEDQYYNISGKVNDHIRSLIPAPIAPTPPIVPQPAPAAAVIAPHHIQIPRLNVPQFSGNYDEWRSFYDLFIAAVHSNPSLQPVHKLQYLKSLLKGEAEALLRQTPITEANYAIAWQTLVERFNNPRALINSHLRRLFNQSKCEDSAAGLRQLIDNTTDCINAIRILNVDTTTWDCVLVYTLSQLLPVSTLTLWEQSIPRNTMPTFANLINFLEDRFRVLEFSPSSSTSKISKMKTNTYHVTSRNCNLCKNASHALRACSKFINMNANERLDYVSKSKLCKNCLTFGHQTKECNSPRSCNTCGLRHNSLLHLTKTVSSQQLAQNKNDRSVGHQYTQPITANSSQISSSVAGAQSVAHNTSSHACHVGHATDNSVLATALINVTAYDGQQHVFRALLDNASQESFVSKRIADFIGTRPRASSMVVSGVGESRTSKPLGQMLLSFGSLVDPNFIMTVEAIVLKTVTCNLPASDMSVDSKLLEGLQLADPSYGTPGPIDILLSAKVFAALTLPSIKKNDAADTVAIKTKLGWVLYGETKPTQHVKKQVGLCFHVSSNTEVSDALQSFWRLEEVPMNPILSPDDRLCEEIYDLTHTRNADGKYCVKLPFKSDPPIIGQSRDKAVSRFLQIERKLSGNPQLKADYQKCINEYIELDHMHPVESTENRLVINSQTMTYSSYYLPHHAVIKSDSTTTKLRVVFDASNKTTNGVSINEAMLTGPVLQDGLFDLLIRWRIHRIAIKADIEKMYRQILVSEDHQPYQRIIWRNSPDEKLQDYQLRTVTFGTAAAPYLAIKTLFQLAKDESTRFPIGSQMLEKDFYVDDLMSGADSVLKAKQKQQEVTNILQSAGFQIRKWSSNNDEVTSDLDKSVREICTSTTKALGIIWCPHSDTLSIRSSMSTIQVSTKRSLLSEVAKLFDPLGWIAPAIISMKILLQDLWLSGVGWDEPLPKSILQNWTYFQNELHLIETIKINRWIASPSNSVIELHGFCDASVKAYAACLYARVKVNETKYVIHLLAAKTKVAPIKQISLPLYAWTDSEIVLCWLQGHPNRWSTFVANRISEIHTTIDSAVWRHVRSKDNPADCASRGIPPSQLINHELWWHGPKWLQSEQSTWPVKAKPVESTTLELKKEKVVLFTKSKESTIETILERHSTLSKATRIIAYLRRWLDKTVKGTQLSAEELHTSRNILIRYTQRTMFQGEYDALSNKIPIDSKSKLRSLNVFIDHNEIIRIGGRLCNADIPYDQKHPMLVPRNSRFTDLLLDYAHKQTLHGGTSIMMAFIRNQFWLIDARNLCRRHVHKCNICFKFTHPVITQLMGNLPRPRVNKCDPFTHTGVDYAGPINLRVRRQPGRTVTVKGYICVFVCLAVKAVHLELVGDLTSSSFLAAQARFIARRGKPTHMYSDNGSNFVRAARDIDLDMKKIQTQYPVEASKSAAFENIQWHFIPPAAPHFGGLWEAGVKSMKFHLKRVVNNIVLTYEEMATVLCQIESCLNSRPLCPLTTDHNDFSVLTPGHFLIGRPLLARPQPSLLDVNFNRLQHWQRVYQITQSFWKQWQNEYLSRLQQRPKWLKEADNLNENELVLLKEDNLPPTQWRLGRIVNTFPGADGLVRVVKIKTADTTLKRPITKICRLPSQ